VIRDLNPNDRECFARVLESRGFQIVDDESSGEFDAVWVRCRGKQLADISSIRRWGFNGPVLLAIGRGERIRLPKGVFRVNFPASLDQIEAAIRAVLPKSSKRARARDAYGFGLDASALAVLLTNTERLIAEPVLAGRGSLVSRRVVEDSAFPHLFVASDGRRNTSLDVHMTSLRRKLALFGVEIVTVRGRGFFARRFRVRRA
jgi:hypothetical protein